MMLEKAAAYQVEALVAEGKSKRIGYGTVIGVEDFFRVDALNAVFWVGCPSCREYRRSSWPGCQQQVNRATGPQPTLPPAVACYTGRCSSRSRQEVRRGCRVRRCVRHATRRCDRHCAQWKRGGR